MALNMDAMMMKYVPFHPSITITIHMMSYTVPHWLQHAIFCVHLQMDAIRSPFTHRLNLQI